MANYNFRSQFNYSYSAKAVTLRATISIGSSGTPTLVSTTGMGIASVAHNGTGDYTINLTRAYASLMMVNLAINSGASAPVAPAMYIKTDHVATAAAPLVNIIMNAAGTPADPASGEKLLIEIVLNDSSLAY